MTTKRTFVSAALALVAGAATLSAQPAPSFGVDSVATLVINAFDMQPSNSNVGTTINVAMQRFSTTPGEFFAGVQVPQGARILAIELDGCDNSDGGKVLAKLYRVEPSGNAPEIALVDTGLVGAPGCQHFVGVLAIPETVDNRVNRYAIGVGNSAFDSTETFGAVRVYYQLQVSPAPGTATFNDVPTSDPAFQFIEAIVASGITAGCGGGNYCPNAPLTRRQMAVFLAKALGLHWPDGSSF